MAFSLFRKRLPEPVVHAAEPPAPGHARTETGVTAETDSAKEILELLELELGGMIRQLERAANSVAGGAQSTAAAGGAARGLAAAAVGRLSDLRNRPNAMVALGK